MSPRRSCDVSRSDWYRVFSAHLAKAGETMSNERLQYVVFLGLSLATAGLIAILYLRNNLFLRKFVGGLNPLLAIALIILLGMALLSLLLSRGWLVFHGGQTLRGLAFSVGLAALFALVMTLVDLRVVLPEDMNVAFPESLLYYPAMAYVAEVVFHLLPLSLLLIVLGPLSKRLGYEGVVWICLLMVSLLEPIYQTSLAFSRPYPTWLTAYVAVHIFLFNLLQLLAFKRYDFVSMYSFRLTYYILFRILWGHVRLRLLF
jgi:hypothetical protein